MKNQQHPIIGAMLAGFVSTQVEAASDGPLELEQLEGPWCLSRSVTENIESAERRTWRFEQDGVLAYQRFRDSEEWTRAAYDLVGREIQTSLGFKLVIEQIEDEAMTARQGETLLLFRRGLCD